MQKRKPNQILEKHYAEQGGGCYYCEYSTPFERITRDHIVPVTNGGTLANADNCVFACGTCNAKLKRNLTLKEFREIVKTKLLSKLRQTKKNKKKSNPELVKKYNTIISNINKTIANGSKRVLTIGN